MLAASFESGCEPEAMGVATVPVPVLTPDHVLVKVSASAVNRADTLQRRGKYPVPAGMSTILGLEAAGTIEAVDPTAPGNWHPGTRVMALLSGGGNAQYVVVPIQHLMAIPENLSLHDAAAIPEAWLTAFQLLTIAETKPGDKVLIHAGASGVGTAAIQLVTKVFGATAIATVGSEEKAEFVRSWGAQHVFNYKTDDWLVSVRHVTDGKGVNVVLDCVGASYWEKNADALTVDGRWVLYGLMGGADISGNLLSKILQKRIRLQGTTLRARCNEYKAKLIEEFTAKALPHFATGELKPVIDSKFDLADIGKAHRRMEDNLTMGKIVLNIQ
uniref:Enoyl reductase (ER) domain-containing protein n=1 Tax=Plectus sambesii TaxID=2011161 RepID=A0A914WM10_9BILA